MSVTHYTKLSEEKRRQFKGLIETCKVFCAARRMATEFVQCALDGGLFPMYAWNKLSALGDLVSMEEQEVLGYLNAI